MAANIVLIILKFVLKEDVQNGALIINLVIMIIADLKIFDIWSVI